MQIINEQTELVDVRSLKPHPKNVNRGNTDLIAESITESGFYGQIIAQRSTGHILVGHHRLQAAQQLGAKEVPVTWVDVDNTRALKIMLADNKTAEAAHRDEEALAALLSELKLTDDLTGTGYVDADLDSLIASIADNAPAPEPAEPAPAPEAQMDRAAELQKKWKTERGQLWTIPSKTQPGKTHRLICGDSTDPANITRLLDGQKVNGIITSPPYLQQRTYEGGMASDWHGLMAGVWDAVKAHLQPDAQVFVNLGLVHREGRVIRYWDSFITHVEDSGTPLFGWYVWDKLNGMPGDWNGRLAPAHEWIFHFTAKGISSGKIIETKFAGKAPVSRSFRKADGGLQPFTAGEGSTVQDHKIPDSVIRQNPQKGGDLMSAHPAVYPVELPTLFMEAWPLGLWYEPFTGSGTTIIAAEQTKQICCGMELEPKYLAVILERLSGMGLTPELQ